jgi:hypothetical protein
MSEHEPKPVAYRWTYDLGQAWSLGPNAPTDFRFGEPDEIQPLYPASVVTALQEEVGRLRRAVQTLEMVVNRTENQWVKWEAAAHTAEARANAAEQRLKEAVKVLEPFSCIGGEMSHSMKPDDHDAYGYNDATVTFGHFRAARAFIKEAGE